MPQNLEFLEIYSIKEGMLLRVGWLPRLLLPPRALRQIPTPSALSRRRALLLSPSLPLLLSSSRSPYPHPSSHSCASAMAAPPVARKVPRELVENGDVRVDNYYWLRDDSRSDPDVVAHLRAENDYTATLMSGENYYYYLFCFP